MSEFTRRKLIKAGMGAMALSALRSPALAQAWPSKSIRVIVAAPVGGQTDLIARTLGDYLSRHLGQPVVVDNKSGAGGVIGASEAKRAAPDGYTLLCAISSTLIQSRVTVKDLPYDPEHDFIYLSTITGRGAPLVVAEKTGATNLKEFVEYAKKVDKLDFGGYGAGSAPHLIAETLSRQYGLKFEMVHYRGEAPMWADVASQTLDVAYGSYAGSLPVIQSGKGRAIGTVGGRLQPYPNLQTLVEQGARGKYFDTRGFTAFAAPTGTPIEIVKRLSDLLYQAGQDSKIREVLASNLLDTPNSFDEAQTRFKDDTHILLGLLRELNL